MSTSIQSITRGSISPVIPYATKRLDDQQLLAAKLANGNYTEIKLPSLSGESSISVFVDITPIEQTVTNTVNDLLQDLVGFLRQENQGIMRHQQEMAQRIADNSEQSTILENLIRENKRQLAEITPQVHASNAALSAAMDRLDATTDRLNSAYDAQIATSKELQAAQQHAITAQQNEIREIENANKALVDLIEVTERGTQYAKEARLYTEELIKLRQESQVDSKPESPSLPNVLTPPTPVRSSSKSGGGSSKSIPSAPCATDPKKTSFTSQVSHYANKLWNFLKSLLPWNLFTTNHNK